MLRARRRLAAFPGRLQDVWAGLQQRNVSSAGTGGGGDSGSGGTGGGSKSSGGDPPSAPEHFAKAAADSFHKCVVVCHYCGNSAPACRPPLLSGTYRHATWPGLRCLAALPAPCHHIP